MECNIDQKDRNNRIAIGVILIIAALLDFGKTAMVLIGFILIIEGFIGWCGIPILLEKFKGCSGKNKSCSTKDEPKK